MDFKRILQDDNGTIAGLCGDSIARFICVQSRDDDSGRLTPCIFLLKTAKVENWQRFYLDAGICCWDEYAQLPQDDFVDPETYPWVDLGLKYQLNGLEIISVDVTPHEKGVRLKVTLSEERNVWISTRHMEDDTRLEIDFRELI